MQMSDTRDRGTTASRLPGWLSRIVALPERIRSSEYVAVSSSPRFRATQRRRSVSAARVGFLVIAAASIFDALALIDRETSMRLPLLAMNAAVAAVALAGWVLLRSRLRRQPDPIAALVTLSLTAATATTGLLIPELAIESAGYLILIPVLVTLIVPWSTVVHVRWLAISTVVVVGYFVLTPSSAVSVNARADLVIVYLVAVGASLAGHGLLHLASVRNHSQIRKITQLRRRADADMKELERVHLQLEETARTDPLTGARNRLRLAEDLRTMRARTNRLGETHGLVAIDLDRFKLINDERGHLAGDDVLKAVVAAVQRTIRAEDEIYRFGGEEFLVIVRVQDDTGLRAAAERLRKAVADLGIAHPSNEPSGLVTISLGGALITRDDMDATDDEWFARADAALYAAKTGGRNRVVIAD